MTISRSTEITEPDRNYAPAGARELRHSAVRTQPPSSFPYVEKKMRLAWCRRKDAAAAGFASQNPTPPAKDSWGGGRASPCRRAAPVPASAWGGRSIPRPSCAAAAGRFQSSKRQRDRSRVDTVFLPQLKQASSFASTGCTVDLRKRKPYKRAAFFSTAGGAFSFDKTKENGGPDPVGSRRQTLRETSRIKE
jgi:hypothetical protein